eukprot:2403090-Amphidinium_carterae.1
MSSQVSSTLWSSTCAQALLQGSTWAPKQPPVETRNTCEGALERVTANLRISAQTSTRSHVTLEELVP